MSISIFTKYLYNLSEIGYCFDSALVPELKKFQKDTTRESIAIDFGCGQKPFGYLFERPVFKGAYWGLDVYQGNKVDVIYDGENIPFRASTVDLVFSTSVFEHVLEVEPILNEVFRILKPQGMLLIVVPFISHVHGTPFDYHRPTRFGWKYFIRKAFGDTVLCDVIAVDGRFNCIVNVITAQINFCILDLLRRARSLFRKDGMKKSLYEGGASPESHNTIEMKIAYTILKINPFNFVLGMLSWVVSRIPIRRRPEGEITMGYLIKVKKILYSKKED